MLRIFTILADWLTYSLLGFTPGTAAGEAVHFFLEDLPKLFCLLAVMIYVIALFRARMDAERMRRLLSGRNRLLCYLLAALLGALTPFCSCSSIPLFLGFAAARLPLGIAMAFLITSPTVNEAAMGMLGGSLGWGLRALYMALVAGARFEVLDPYWQLARDEAAFKDYLTRAIADFATREDSHAVGLRDQRDSAVAGLRRRLRSLGQADHRFTLPCHRALPLRPRALLAARRAPLRARWAFSLARGCVVYSHASMSRDGQGRL